MVLIYYWKTKKEDFLKRAVTIDATIILNISPGIKGIMHAVKAFPKEAFVRYMNHTVPKA